jgi:hypothetical protein
MDLTEFLTARYGEQEARAQRAITDWEDQDWVELDADPLDHIHANNPHAVLADTVAKRAILDEHSSLVGGKSSDGCLVCYQDPEALDGPTYPCPTLRHLAGPYADHPDYDQSWKA